MIELSEKWRKSYNWFKVRWWLINLPLYLTVVLAPSRNHKSTMTKEQEFLVFALFSELENSPSVNYVVDGCRIRIFSGDVMIVIWKENAPYADMEFEIIKKDDTRPTDNLTVVTPICFDYQPSGILAKKMREVIGNIKTRKNPIDKDIGSMMRYNKNIGANLGSVTDVMNEMKLESL